MVSVHKHHSGYSAAAAQDGVKTCFIVRFTKGSEIEFTVKSDHCKIH